MKIKPSIYLSDMYGKAGSGEVRKTRHGYILQNITVPTNPQSESQMKQRENTKYATQYWQKLSPFNRQAWQSFAINKLGANRHGVNAVLDGYTCYLKVNIVRLNNGKAILKNPYEDEGEVMSILYEEDLSALARTRADLLSQKFGALEVGITFYKIRLASSDSPTLADITGSLKVYKFAENVFQLELNDGSTGKIYSCSYMISTSWTTWCEYVQTGSILTAKDDEATDSQIYSAKCTNSLLEYSYEINTKAEAPCFNASLENYMTSGTIRIIKWGRVVIISMEAVVFKYTGTKQFPPLVEKYLPVKASWYQPAQGIVSDVQNLYTLTNVTISGTSATKVTQKCAPVRIVYSGTNAVLSFYNIPDTTTAFCGSLFYISAT